MCRLRIIKVHTERGRPGTEATRKAVRGQRPSTHLSQLQASCVIVSVGAALDLDTYRLSNLISLRCAERAKPGWGKPVLIMHIGFFACFFTPYLSNSCFRKIATLFFMLECSTEAVGIAHKPPCSL